MKVLLGFALIMLCSTGFSQNPGLSFSAADGNYILTPHVTGYPLNNFTLEFWIRNSKTSSPQSLFQKGWCYGSKMSWHLQLRDDNTIDFNFDSDGNCSSVNSYKCDSVLAWGVCYHIAVTYSAAGVKIYYNGQLQTGSYTSGGYCGNLYNTTEPLRIGVYKFNAGNLGNNFNGMMDEVRIWNRVLTQSEILANFQEPLTGSEANLVLYYKLDGNITGPSVVIPNLATVSGTALNGLTYSSTSATPFSTNSCFLYVSANNAISNDIKINAYPNPSGDQITIDFNEPQNPSELFQVEIFDITGKILYNEQSQMPITLKKESFSAGIYYVKVFNSKGVNTARVVFE